MNVLLDCDISVVKEMFWIIQMGNGGGGGGGVGVDCGDEVYYFIVEQPEWGP